MPQSSYIAYFDESGDHGLVNIDANFPVFVLCGCVFHIPTYLTTDLGRFSGIKFAYFAHDAVVFHSREIRKQLGPFQILSNAATRANFMNDIAAFYQNSAFTIIAAGIDKVAHKRQYKYPADPYGISLLFCLERLYGHLKDKGEDGHSVTCVFERRGDNEDNALAAEFASICAGANQWGPLPFRMVFASKQTNMPGLQIADLAAYPIARHIMNPAVVNPAYNAVSQRFRKSPWGKVSGWGLKVFP